MSESFVDLGFERQAPGFHVNQVVVAQRHKRRHLMIVINNKSKQPVHRNNPFTLLKRDKAGSEDVESEVKKSLDLGNSQNRRS